jgi:hypothetical protein
VDEVVGEAVVVIDDQDHDAAFRQQLLGATAPQAKPSVIAPRPKFSLGLIFGFALG